MSFDIDALFEGNFLTASIISSLDIYLKEKLKRLRFIHLPKLETLGDICKIGIKDFTNRLVFNDCLIISVKIMLFVVLFFSVKKDFIKMTLFGVL